MSLILSSKTRRTGVQPQELTHGDRREQVQPRAVGWAEERMGTKEVKTTTRDASSKGFHERAVETQGDGRRLLGGLRDGCL